MSVEEKRRCDHYSNELEVWADCCKAFFPCNKCHNEAGCATKMYNVDIGRVRCRHCAWEGAPARECGGCQVRFATNCCLECRLWCSSVGDMYHCDKCDCCRKGKQEDYFHCDGCQLCLSNNCRDNHVCAVYDKKATCPICLEQIFKSGDDVIILRCNHLLHKNCFNQLVNVADERKRIPTCTLCKKSAVRFGQYERKYDEHVARYPSELPWRSRILCNDCCREGVVPYHPDYHKCAFTECRSYNTSKIEVLKTPAAVAEAGASA